MKRAALLCLSMMSCATAQTVGTRSAQLVADADRIVDSPVEAEAGEARAAELKKAQGEAADDWLGEELVATDGATDDAALHQVLLILSEAKRRGREQLVERAEAARVRIVVGREPELVAMISEGRWLPALERAAAWSANAPDGSPAALLFSRTRDGVKKAIEAAISPGASAPEKYVLQRMKRWLGEAPSSGPEFDAMSTLLARTPSLSWGDSSCAPAREVTLARAENGTPLAVTITLGSCEVSMQETRGIPRTGSYSVQVERERDEPYTVEEEVTVMVPVSSQTCGQKTIYLGTGNQKTSAIVSDCSTTTTNVPKTQTQLVTKYRRVKYMDSESRSETFSVDQRRYAVSAPVRITVTGDGVEVSQTFEASDQFVDEQYWRAHGGSASFRSGVPLSLQRGLSRSISGFTTRAIDEWTHQRALSRMNKARQSASRAEARALAIEAVALESSFAEAAVPLVNWTVTAPQLLALVSGSPSVTPVEMKGGRGLALPPPSTSLEERYAFLEERHRAVTELSNSDMLIGLGAGVLPTPDQKAIGALAVEIQYGYVPTFSAISHFLLRIEGDLQMFLSKFLVGDFSLRPEVGVRAGPFSLSAVAAAGGRLAHEQTQLDLEENGRFSAIAYAGYGAHLSLKLGPVLLDAMVLRLHEAGASSPIATRADALLGLQLSEAIFLFSRLRYVAYRDFWRVQEVVSTADRYATITLGVMVQF